MQNQNPKTEEAQVEKKPVQEKKAEETGKKIAVVLIRGLINLNTDIKDTLYMLGLRKKHNCVVLKDTPSIQGMLHKCKDYITWGNISEETLSQLKKVRLQEKAYCLNPPKGGFERKGIKKSFTKGGALGNRGDNINKLITRMIA
jgi:large subunit ribosomal protein L30